MKTLNVIAWLLLMGGWAMVGKYFINDIIEITEVFFRDDGDA